MTIVTLALITATTASIAFAAGGLLDSKLVTGTQKMFQDISAAIAIICPLAAAACFGFCMFRKAAAEEQDQIMWKKRATNSIIAGVAGCLGSTIIALVAHYYA